MDMESKSKMTKYTRGDLKMVRFMGKGGCLKRTDASMLEISLEACFTAKELKNLVRKSTKEALKMVFEKDMGL